MSLAGLDHLHFSGRFRRFRSGVGLLRLKVMRQGMEGFVEVAFQRVTERRERPSSVPTEVIEAIWAARPTFEMRVAAASEGGRVTLAYGEDRGWQRRKEFQPSGYLHDDAPSRCWTLDGPLGSTPAEASTPRLLRFN